MVYNDVGSALYERDVEYMSTGALSQMLTHFGFHRNDSSAGGGGGEGDPRKAARGSLKGHARTAVAIRARLRAAAAAAKAAEEAEKLRSELAQGKAKRDELQEKLNAAERASRDGRCAQARQIWGRWGWGVGEGGT